MKKISSLILFLFLGLYGVFFAIPIVMLFSKGLNTEGSAIFSQDVLTVGLFSLKQALLSTFFSVLVGTFLGVSLARAGFSKVTKKILVIFYESSFFIPSLVVVFIWVSLLGKKGILNVFLENLSLDWTLYSLETVVLAHVFLNAPWFGVQLYYALSRIPESYLLEYKTHGASTFSWIVWPKIKSTIYLTSYQIFQFTLTSFAIVLLLGGGFPIETLETSIYTALRGAAGIIHYSIAIQCAVLQLILQLALGVVVAFSIKKQPKWEFQEEIFKISIKPWKPLTKTLAIGFCSIFVVYLFSIFWDFSALSLYKLFQNKNFWSAFKISFWLSSVSSTVLVGIVFTIFTSLVILRNRKINFYFQILSQLPSGVSPLVLGVSLWMVFENYFNPFEGSFSLIVLLEVFMCLPFVVKMLWPHFEQISYENLDALETYGLSFLKRLVFVEWPRWRRVFMQVFVLVFGVVLSEVAALSLFFSEERLPLPIWISRLFGEYRFEEAHAATFLLFVFAVLVSFSRFFLGSRENER